MLNVLRENFRNAPYLKIVLLVVAVGLVAFLGNFFSIDQSGRGAGAWAARVNGTEIPVRQFVNTARNIDQYYRGLFGNNYDQIRPNLQIGQQAINTLVEQEVILQDARRLGLSSSKEELAEQIRTNPGFQNAEGRFIGVEEYRQLVDRSVTGGVASFERDLSHGLITEKWNNLVTQPVSVTDTDLEEVYRQRNEKTSVDYVVVKTADQEVGDEVGDGELRQWYDAHQDDYQREAGWKIRYVVVDREAQLADVELSSDEIQNYYDANVTRYQHPEQRRARHILFRIEAEATAEERERVRKSAEETLARLEGGEEFAALARTLSEDTISAEQGGDLGFFGRGQMVPSFEEAVFQTEVGELAPLTDSPFGLHVIQVTDNREAGLTPLEQVEESIRQALEVQKAQEKVLTESQSLREQIASADAMHEVAGRLGLEVTELSITRDALPPELGAGADFIPTLDTLAPGEVAPPLTVAAGMAVVALDDLLPAAAAPLEDVREEVTAAVLLDRARAAALAAAGRALDRHGSVAAAAPALSLETQASGELPPRQPLPGTGGSTAELNDMLFGDAVQIGDRGVVEVPEGAVIYEVSARVPFDPDLFASCRDRPSTANRSSSACASRS